MPNEAGSCLVQPVNSHTISVEENHQTGKKKCLKGKFFKTTFLKKKFNDIKISLVTRLTQQD